MYLRNFPPWEECSNIKSGLPWRIQDISSMWLWGLRSRCHSFSLVGLAPREVDVQVES